jgi:hypothetical protein
MSWGARWVPWSLLTLDFVFGLPCRDLCELGERRGNDCPLGFSSDMTGWNAVGPQVGFWAVTFSKSAGEPSVLGPQAVVEAHGDIETRSWTWMASGMRGIESHEPRRHTLNHSTFVAQSPQ